MTELPAQGQRIALRYRDASGPRELIGYVQGTGPDGLALLDRTLTPRLLAWETLESWRAVPQVPRGRNPLAADPALLDRMAADPRLDLSGIAPYEVADDAQVARLADLLGPAVPDQGPDAYDLGEATAEYDADGVRGRALVVGEWATIRRTTGASPGATNAPNRAEDVDRAVRALARWAAYRDARSVQVRGTDRALAGFTWLRRS